MILILLIRFSDSTNYSKTKENATKIKAKLFHQQMNIPLENHSDQNLLEESIWLQIYIFLLQDPPIRLHILTLSVLTALHLLRAGL